MIEIAIDVMSGDNAPLQLIKGAVEAASEYDVKITLCGDEGIIKALLRWLNGDFSDKSICTIEETSYNHIVAFAAERSRVDGTVIDIKEYQKLLKKACE